MMQNDPEAEKGYYSDSRLTEAHGLQVNRRRLKVIGITGGVGAGKSEVLKLLEECSDSCILKADEAAHEVENRECCKRLTALLSEDILSDDGTIDKTAGVLNNNTFDIIGDKEILSRLKY